MQIELTIDRFEEDKAVLRGSDNLSIVWPKDQLPEGAHEGAILYFSISTDQAKEKDKKELAKNILNEILGK